MKGITTFIVVLILLAFHPAARSQEDKPGDKGHLRGMTVEDYIKRFAPIAQEEMRKAGIPASITLAQGILESNFGNSELALNANNHFGIKCHSDWTGKGYLKDDETKKECFRVYNTPEESFIDHVNFLKNRSNYAALFKLDVTDYKGWARGLKSAGYATNPEYPTLLLRIIEDHKLYEFDKGGNGAAVTSTPTTAKEVVEQYNDKIVTFNDVKTVIVQPNETLDDIALKFKVSKQSLITYNDIQDGDSLIMGSKIYLQPKRFVGFDRTHEVKKGETMRSISQKEAIKINALYRKNRMHWGEEPAVGQVLYLKETNPIIPKLKTEDELRQDINDDIDAREMAIREKFEKERADSIAKTNPAGTISPTGTAIIEKQATPAMPKIAGEPEGKAVVPPTTAKFHTIPIENPGDTMVLKFHDDGLSASVIVHHDDDGDTNKAILHNVEARETLFSISQKYYTRVDSLKAWNTLNGPLAVGQTIIVGYGKIPEPPKIEIINAPKPDTAVAASPKTEVQKTDPSSYSFHIVKPGEGLYGIAKQNNVTTEQIRQWNGLTSDNLKVGQSLVVTEPRQKAKPSTTAHTSTVYHLVVAHETLSAIARQYGVTLQQLKDWNKLTDGNVKIGQKLIVGQ